MNHEEIDLLLFKIDEIYAKQQLINSYLKREIPMEAIEDLMVTLEKATILCRNTVEHINKNKIYSLQKQVSLPYIHVTGSIELYQFRWLHIKLNTLLPHCRYQTPQYLTDTIERLLTSFQENGRQLPFFTNALLVIDEHCAIESRTVFDQDNKGWKAVPNALKGKVFSDDDQFCVSLSLMSTYDRIPSCHIYVLDMVDASEFFGLKAENYV